MTLHRFRTLLAISAAMVTVFVIGVPAHAQMTVFDPSNYSQNVLTAARALQQVNNQIQSLQNQATSLINEARNLASLPYSALEQLQQTIGQTQLLLTQAQLFASENG
jgi:P-type conjugative transfer protein TrbJ